MSDINGKKNGSPGIARKSRVPSLKLKVVGGRDKTVTMGQQRGVLP
jgi:hypothetical protein